MEAIPLTPFPSPSLSATTLPTNAFSDTSAESIQNVNTPFHALRRSVSYHSEIAPAVSTIFDMIPSEIKSPNDSHDYATPHDTNSTKSDHLITNLHPLFERVFLIRSRPRTIDGHETNLHYGMLTSNNIDSHQWRLTGVHLTSDGRIVIYRAHSHDLLPSIFIAVPFQWSIEGLQFAKVR
jgi:hypothetical protein